MEYVASTLEHANPAARCKEIITEPADADFTGNMCGNRSAFALARIMNCTFHCLKKAKHIQEVRVSKLVQGLGL